MFWHGTHELVDTIPPEKLEASIRDGSIIEFNISKEANERQAKCTVYFDNEDIIPMINGLMSRLKSQQTALLEMNAVMKNQEMIEDAKLETVNEIIEKFMKA
jgi:hypothetical protein